MKLYGLIGFPLKHSFSQKYFTEKFEKGNISSCRYENFPLEDIGDFKELIHNNKDLAGLNVTIPYKQGVIMFLDEVDVTAREIGAVNTIKIYRNKSKLRLKGFNTDAYGFKNSLSPYIEGYHKKALVLGTGGSSKAVNYVLNSIGFQVTRVSRKPLPGSQIGYGQVDEELISQNLLIVNTTPLGMFPDTDACPDIPYHLLTEKHVLFDLIYNPAETLFLKRGREKGAVTINGLPMLHAQAEKAWEIWNDPAQ
ncbi:MAG: shikimate dehydrogenase [Bacteroidales bacterium]|nr:shikimate dehydrogenase [Bacteroidales bacterium]